ncbi:MAG: hypothetical protein V8S24_08655 [Gordonibacter pamelaeae]
MRRLFGKEFAFAHVLLAALVLVVTCMPNQRMVTVSYYPLLAGLAVIEVLYLLRLAALRRRGAFSTGPTDIVVLVWALFIVWDVCATKLDIAPTVIVPAPEAVFNVFFAQADVIGADIVSSVTLLVMGYVGGLALGVVLGIVCGWIPRLRAMFFPIANVLAPIPPTVFAPYLIVLLPTFRTASCFIILLGVFWPQFLNMVVRTSSLDAQLLDNARTLGVRNFHHDHAHHPALRAPRGAQGPARVADHRVSHAHVRRDAGRVVGHRLLHQQREQLRQLHQRGGGHHRVRRGGDGAELRDGLGAAPVHHLAVGGGKAAVGAWKRGPEARRAGRLPGSRRA